MANSINNEKFVNVFSINEYATAQCYFLEEVLIENTMDQYHFKDSQSFDTIMYYTEFFYKEINIPF